MPEVVLELPHNPEKSNQTEFQYRLAWARTYLKQYGLIENSSRGVWVIPPDKRDIANFDPQEVIREIRERHRREREARQEDEPEVADDVSITKTEPAHARERRIWSRGVVVALAAAP